MKKYSTILQKFFPLLLGILYMGTYATERNWNERPMHSVQQIVTGTVNGEDGVPIPGLGVMEKGTTNGVITDFDGNYSIEVGANAILVFSFLGYETQEIAVNGQSKIDVIVKEDVSSLDEIVVVGYGTQRKQDLTGAVSVVKTEELIQQPSAEITSQLQGKASGVTITGGGQPGEAPQIKIRGANTFGNNTPLYVVDGIPTGAIDNINPNDIETIQVLKDAASASIYGSRAANGVIIITTKKGKGKVKVTYDGYYGRQQVRGGNPWDILSPQEMADLTFQAIRNTNPGDPIDHPQYGNGANPVLPNYIAPVGAESVDESLYNVNPNYTDPSQLNDFYRIVQANKQGTNWFQEIFSPADITSHNVSLSNGTEHGRFFFSMNYFDQKGTIDHTYLKKYTIRANSIFNISNNVRVGENLSYTIRENPQIDALSEGSAVPLGWLLDSNPSFLYMILWGILPGLLEKVWGTPGILLPSRKEHGTTEGCPTNFLGMSFSRSIYWNILPLEPTLVENIFQILLIPLLFRNMKTQKTIP